MNPVANITPAANALIAKKMSFSGRKASMVFPKRGTQTPMAPAMRIENIATILYLVAKEFLFESLVSGSHVQLLSPCTKEGNRMRKKQRNCKN